MTLLLALLAGPHQHISNQPGTQGKQHPIPSLWKTGLQLPSLGDFQSQEASLSAHAPNSPACFFGGEGSRILILINKLSKIPTAAIKLPSGCSVRCGRHKKTQGEHLHGATRREAAELARPRFPLLSRGARRMPHALLLEEGFQISTVDVGLDPLQRERAPLSRVQTTAPQLLEQILHLCLFRAQTQVLELSGDYLGFCAEALGPGVFPASVSPSTKMRRKLGAVIPRDLCGRGTLCNRPNGCLENQCKSVFSRV